MITSADIDAWIADEEGEHLEFKEARHTFNKNDLHHYCAALANEGGGKLVLGVTDRIPRRVVGSSAFSDLGSAKTGILQKLRIRVEAEEVQHPHGRVVVFTVPSRPIGMPVACDGAYQMRCGESLVNMTPDVLKRIFDEAELDHSSQVCEGATLIDLSPEAIARLRHLVAQKSGNAAYATLTDQQFLADLGLVTDGGVTVAALVLLGSKQALSRLLPQAEMVFEYRSSDASIDYQQRLEFREGFLLYDDDLWNTVNLRNEVQQFQSGLYRWEIPTFNETVVREAILNAVAHRDYRHGGSVFVRQSPRRLEIVSPGGFPPGITPENVLNRQMPRNRLIAETLQRCGLVERSGQGMDRMFGQSVLESKPLPDFAGTDEHQVEVTLRGEIQNPEFLRFLEKIGAERLAMFGSEHLLVLDLVQREQKVPPHLRARLDYLITEGVVESLGRGRGTRYILARRFYEETGRRGVYTRMVGLDRETKKELLLKHIVDNQATGSPLRELCQVLPDQTRRQVQSLLRELAQGERKIHSVGVTRGARWYPGSEDDSGP